MSDLCAIWGRSAKVEMSKPARHGFPEVWRITSHRAGGSYRITGSALAMIQNSQSLMLLKLTEYVTRNNLIGLEPQIDENNLEQIRALDLPWVGERAERLLMHLATRSSRIGETLGFKGDDLEQVQAITASIGEREVHYLLEMLRDDELVHLFDPFGDHLPDVRIRPEGFRRLHELRAGQVSSQQAFVAMWFSDETEAAYKQGIEPGIRAAGYVPLRIDRKEHNNKIDDEIVAEIRRSKFVVADFTSEPERARGGVYFEAGFAKGLGREVIWTCRKDCLKFVHFDTRQYAHIAWTSPEELRDALTKRICAVLGDGPLMGRSTP